MNTIPESFKGWYFEDGYFCTPEGDRFHPLCIRMCHYLKQAREFSELLHWRPAQPNQDVVMVGLMDLVQRHARQTQLTQHGAEQSSAWREPASGAPAAAAPRVGSRGMEAQRILSSLQLEYGTELDQVESPGDGNPVYQA